MAGDSSSVCSVPQHDVFLSFQGKDAGEGFVSVLYHFLDEAGIRVFREDDDFQKGSSMDPKIHEAIQKSRICVAIFSRNYAASRWCLEELAEMMESGKLCVPIFLDVTPADVKDQIGPYQVYFDQYRKDKDVGTQVTDRWGRALRHATTIQGFQLGQQSYVQLCKQIVGAILDRLTKKKVPVPDKLVIMEDQIGKVMKLLDLESDHARRQFVAIHGMGGLGKTTLAKVVYNRIYHHFDRCYFIDVIREITSQSDLQLLHKQIFGPPPGVSEITWLKEELRSKKVLIVLDGVDKEEQMDIFLGEHAADVFGEGSRVIITTRDRRVVPQPEKIVVYEMSELTFEQAVQLVSLHVLGETSPPKAYCSLFDQVVRTVGQLPLVLEVTAPFLRNESIDKWELLLKSFKPSSTILENLKISYDALEDEHKQIFLDIACFCNNKDAETVSYMWKARNLNPKSAFEALIPLSLVKIVKNKFWMHNMHVELGRDLVYQENVEDPSRRSRLWLNEEAVSVLQTAKGAKNKFWMHNMHVELGRNLVYQENVEDPSGCSRLWLNEEAVSVLQTAKKAKNVEAMHLSSYGSSQDYTFTDKEFASMQKLRFLEFDGVSLKGNFKNLLPNLLWLSWHHCPLDIAIINISLWNLVILDLSCSIITEKWEGWRAFQVAKQLQVLDLRNCKNLTTTPDLSCFPSLERLILEGCDKLTNIDSSIGKLKRLSHLDINGCNSLVELFSEIKSLTSLKEICAFGLSLNPFESLDYILEISRSKYDVVVGFSEHHEISEPLRIHMENAGINVFSIDKMKYSIEGEEKLLLFRAIDKAKIYVPIFSADCGKRFEQELSHMVKSQRKSVGQQIVPVFYNVDPSDMEKMEHCNDTIRAVVRLKGLQLNVEGFEDGCKWFADYILNKLKYVSPAVGFENQVKELKKLLDVESGGVMIVGIHGISGIGKTTLAKSVFDQLCSQFHGCSFLRDIRERTKCLGLQHLQDQLLKDVLGAESDMEPQTNKGWYLHKKVLIVLDDVDQSMQIKKLVGKSSFLGSGSRIIVTTQDIDVLSTVEETLDGCILKWSKEVRTFEMNKMNDDEACDLFFSGKVSSPHKKQSIAKQIVEALQGIPLTLEICGSFLDTELTNKSECDANTMRHRALEDNLKLCYDNMANTTKQVFLDIACFFSGMGKAIPSYMWDDADRSIQDLTSLRLVKFVDGDKLWMHDVVRNLGKSIASGQIKDIANSSRIWGHVDSLLHILKGEENQKMEQANVEALSLPTDIFCQNTVSIEKIQKLVKLRFLELHGVRYEVSPLVNNVSLPQLMWLSFHLCPLEFPGANLDLSNLVVLDFSRSSIVNEWAGWAQLKMTKLKVLNLTSCIKLTSTPDLSGYMFLEILILEGCANLVQIHNSIETLTYLKVLNLKGCNALNGLPALRGPGMEKIVMTGNNKSFNIPSSINQCTSLLVLEIANVEMTTVVLDVGQLKSLERLTLSACLGMKKAPISLSCLTSLIELDFSRAELTRLPDSIGGLKLLRVLRLEASLISQLPSCIGELEKLEELYASCCRDLQELPSEIGNLSNLRTLDLSRTRISSLPKTVSHLFLLQTLHMESCNELNELPELPAGLVSLRVKSRRLCKLPDLLKLHSLMDVQLSYALSKRKLPTSLPGGTITSSFLQPPSSVLLLRSLLPLKKRSILYAPYFPSNVSSLLLSHLDLGKILPSLSNLKNLTFLELYDCFIKETDESTGVGKLGSVEHLSAQSCTISDPELFGFLLPRKLRVLSITKCKFLNGVCDLSKFRDLILLEISDCTNLKEIRGLSGLDYLQVVSIHHCISLLKMGDLSNLTNLKSIKINNCGKLREVEGLIKQLASLKHFELQISEAAFLNT